MTKRNTIRTGSSREPVVVRLSSGYAHLVRRHPVDLPDFLALDLIPNCHPVWHLVNEPLRRKVIPTPDAEQGRDAEQPRRPHVVHLGRAEVQKRCEEQHVRTPLFQKPSNGRIERHHPLHASDDGGAHSKTGPRAHTWKTTKCHGQPRRLRLGSLLELRGLVVSWVEIPPVIERPSKPGRQGVPGPVLRGRHPAVRDTFGALRKSLQYLHPAEHVLPIRHQMEAMTTLGQKAHGRLEVSEKPEMACGEKDVHAVGGRLHAVDRGGLDLGEVPDAAEQDNENHPS